LLTFQTIPEGTHRNVARLALNPGNDLIWCNDFDEVDHYAHPRTHSHLSRVASARASAKPAPDSKQLGLDLVGPSTQALACLFFVMQLADQLACKFAIMCKDRNGCVYMYVCVCAHECEGMCVCVCVCVRARTFECVCV